ncbi:MAG TPA: tetratricopeptide repeat protein [Ferruginibacter sp.]|nr:tetratricopeptide repeat protein [Ferruginibacter sp.]
MKRIVGLILLLCISQLSFAQPDRDREKAMNNVKQALIFQDQGKMDEALKLLEEAVRLDPETTDVSYELAIAYYRKGQFQKAASVMEKLLKKPDVTAPMYQLLGNSYDSLSNVEKAIGTYLDGLVKFPTSGELYLEMGTMYLSRKEYNAALTMYEKGIRANPAFPSNYYWAAKIYCNSNEAVWGMIYGEIFILLERDTKRTDDISKLLYDTYKKRIHFPSDGKFGVNFSEAKYIYDSATKTNKVPFPKSVYEPTIMLALLREKTVDIASLSRVRRYFLESYFKNNNYQTYPNVLFDFQYRVKKAGFLDQYNYWILYKGDEAAANKWIGANKAKWDAFMNWMKKNELSLDAKYKFYKDQYN